jgi:hypothetical protein
MSPHYLGGSYATMLAKIKIRKSRNSSNPWEYEIIPVRPRAIAKWGSWINYQFNYFDCENSHGRVRTGRLILVQDCCCRDGSSQCDIQCAHQDVTPSGIVQRTIFSPRFRAFICKAVVYLNKEHQENGKHTARGFNAINLGFARNKSAYVLYFPEMKTLMTWNQVKFNEHEFRFWKQKMFKPCLSDNATDTLFKSALDVKCMVYIKLHVGNYSKVHGDKVSDVMFLRVNSQENTFTLVLMHKWVLD